jgi:DNA polymerase III epsilon subunit
MTQHSSANNPRDSIADLRMAFLDVETTGLSPRRGDRVIEIAMARAQNGAIVGTFASLVHPERRISLGASAVNGIYDDDVRDAPRFAEIADAVKDFLRDAVIVCHNAPFDLGFVSSEMERAGKKFSAPCVLDTLQIARANYRFGSNGLQALARRLAIPTPHAHRALGDALTTHEIFKWFVSDLWGENQPTLEALMKAQGSRRRLGASQVVLPPEIEEALSRGTRLRIEYVDMRGSRSERWVTPRQVIEQREATYLIAFCHLRQEERNFRMDRIVKMEIEKT